MEPQKKHQLYHLKASTTCIPTETPSVPLNALFTYVHSVSFTGMGYGPGMEMNRKTVETLLVKEE